MTLPNPTTRWALVVGALLAVVVGLLSAPRVHSGEHVNARGIDGACSRAAQDADALTEHPTRGFPDIEGNTHEAAINCLAHWDIAHGREGAYWPGEAVRRDQMASFLARMVRPTDYSLPEGEAQPFDDTAGNVHENDIGRLAEAGVVEGRGDGRYHPAEPVSRAAMASFVARTLEAATGEDLEGQEAAFPDVEGSVHAENVNALAAHGVVQGRADGTYGPQEPVRRDAMASFIARAMDYLADQGHWPVPTTVQVGPDEATNPANLVHRVRSTVFDQWGESAQHTLYAQDVRVEVYRETGGGYELVHTDRGLSGLGGDVSFTYNAGAQAGDHDVVVACPVTAQDSPGADEHWCADVATDGQQAEVVADEGRGADAVAASWADPVDVRAAESGFHPGLVLAHDPERGTLDLQAARQLDDGGARLLRLGYNAADRFTVASSHGDIHDGTVAQFECALQAALGYREEAYPSLTVEYDPASESLFDLSTPADIDHCRSSADFSHEERASKDFPSPGRTQLVDVRTATHAGFDRVAFEFARDPVSWEVTWEEEPIRLDPSGKPVDVDGKAFLKVNMTASARDVDGEMTYEGPTRLRVDGGVATEAVMTSDHHGGMTWVVGLQREAPFRVDVLTEPQRLLVDVAS